jgi:hypothetical protein
LGSGQRRPAGLAASAEPEGRKVTCRSPPSSGATSARAPTYDELTEITYLIEGRRSSATCCIPSAGGPLTQRGRMGGSTGRRGTGCFRRRGARLLIDRLRCRLAVARDRAWSGCWRARWFADGTCGSGRVGRREADPPAGGCVDRTVHTTQDAAVAVRVGSVLLVRRAGLGRRRRACRRSPHRRAGCGSRFVATRAGRAHVPGGQAH